jgi:hypothetical protein
VSERKYPIPGYPDYFITEDARIFSAKSNRFLTTHTNNKGYKYATFSTGAKSSNKNYLISRLMCFVFGKMGSLDSPLEVDHIDNDKSNNRLDNLNPMSVEDHNKKTLSHKNLSSLEVSYCITCSRALSYSTKGSVCRHCITKTSTSSAKEIVDALNSTGTWVGAAALFGISDNALRKRWKKVSDIDIKDLTKQLREGGIKFFTAS